MQNENNIEGDQIIYEERSIEVDEVLNTKVHWFVRYGITIIAVALIIVLVLSDQVVVGDTSFLQKILSSIKI